MGSIQFKIGDYVTFPEDSSPKVVYEIVHVGLEAISVKIVSPKELARDINNEISKLYFPLIGAKKLGDPDKEPTLKALYD